MKYPSNSSTTDSGINSVDPSTLRALAERLAVNGGDRARTLLDELTGYNQAEPLHFRSKSTDTDPVTSVDIGVEEYLRTELARLRPSDVMLGEETGERSVNQELANYEHQVRWIVDPVDGTVNLLYGIPMTAVSIAAELDGLVVAGAVHNITTGETYSASLSGGAHLTTSDGTRTQLRTSECSDPALALVGTGFAYHSHIRADQGRVVARLLPHIRDIRRCGSAALDLCMIAAGRLDAYYERCLKPWDWAAGALIAAEAGAWVQVSTEDTAPTIATTAQLSEAFVALLHRAGETIPPVAQ